jgi:hypothetical protein
LSGTFGTFPRAWNFGNFSLFATQDCSSYYPTVVFPFYFINGQFTK